MRIPRPTQCDYSTSEPLQVPEPSDYHKAWVDKLFNLPTWTCSSCHATMFGTMKYCAYCKFKLGKLTLPPTGLQDSATGSQSSHTHLPRYSTASDS